MFVPAEDVVVNYGASDLHEAERVTHVMRRSKNWLERMIASGVYIDDDIGEPVNEHDETQEAKDKAIGIDGANSDQYTILEMLIDETIEPESEEDQAAALRSLHIHYGVWVLRIRACSLGWWAC
jgi:hypothetical protein